MFGFSHATVPEVTAEGVKRAIDTKEEAFVIDVRTPQEFIRGHLAGSINIPLDELAQKIERVVNDKKMKLYVYCFSGSRSVVAVKKMLDLSYTNVYNIKNGMLAWRAKSYPVIQ